MASTLLFRNAYKFIKKEELYMGVLSFIGGIVVLFWLLGLVFQVGGGLIHTLLVVAAIVFIFDFITKKKV